jgi:hypothetical protein
VHHVSSVRHSSGNEREVRGRQDKGRIDVVAARAINILREPLPDIFLGRKDYKAIPLPYELV